MGLWHSKGVHTIVSDSAQIFRVVSHLYIQENNNNFRENQSKTDSVFVIGPIETNNFKAKLKKKCQILTLNKR